MNHFIKYWILFVLPVLLLLSCDQEAVIQIDLSEVPAQLVIEGAVTNEGGLHQVRISRTVNFDQTNDFPAVGGAVAVLSDDAGHVDTLLEKTAGLYESTGRFPGIPGSSYTLKVWVEGQFFMARSVMPALVPFENLSAIRLPLAGINGLVMMPIFTDPLGPGNNYQFIQSNNGRKQPNIFVVDDRNNDGSQISSLLLAPDMQTVAGDTVTIEMRNIDRATYKYLVALAASRGDGPNANVPANPDNNFGGACLGYFAAYTVQRKTLVAE